MTKRTMRPIEHAYAGLANAKGREEIALFNWGIAVWHQQIQRLMQTLILIRLLKDGAPE